MSLGKDVETAFGNISLYHVDPECVLTVLLLAVYPFLCLNTGLPNSGVV